MNRSFGKRLDIGWGPTFSGFNPCGIPACAGFRPQIIQAGDGKCVVELANAGGPDRPPVGQEKFHPFSAPGHNTTMALGSSMTALDRIDRRHFCQTAAAGVGGLLLPRFARAADPPAADAEAAKPAEPLAYQPGSFTLAVLPDTQFYCESYPHHFYNQTKWIVDNDDRQNIKFMLHLGDITNRNTPEQWEVAQRAIDALDGHVPYALVAGQSRSTAREATRPTARRR